MAITDKEQGVWLNDQVYNKINQGSIWNYNGASGEAGAVWAWGDNEYGNLGSDTTQRSSPVQVLSGFFQKPFNGHEFTGGVNTSGELWLVGRNSYGQLGQNTTSPGISSPVQVPGTWAYAYGSAGTGIGMMGAVRTNGEFYVWGYNNDGNLGQGNLTDYSSPTQIPGTYLTSAGSFTCDNHGPGGVTAVIKDDNTLMMTGNNSFGGLGQNYTTDQQSPVAVPGTNWIRVSSDTYTTGAVRTDGTLYMWGYNASGVCGNNDAGGGGPYWSPSPVKHLSTPNQVPGTTWSKISVGGFAAGAIKTDGTLWMWGRNNQGQLGAPGISITSSLKGYSSPVQVPGTTWSEVAIYSSTVQALKTDGTLWSWGNNNYGQLAQNSEVKYSSPVQIPGTWSVMGWGRSIASAVKP